MPSSLTVAGRLRADRRSPAGLAAFGERWARPGSTRPVTPTPTATASTPRARSGSIATGSSTPSTPTCPTTGSSIDQIAGDLRARGRPGRRSPPGSTATRQINQEGGIDLEQFRIESIVDRVNTTGTVFLGLTVGCAQCHDHKYDPISQREYYRFFAFFNNVDEPEMEISTPAEQARRRRDSRAGRTVPRRVGGPASGPRRTAASMGRGIAAGCSRRTSTSRPSWPSTCARDKRTKEQTRVLVELMLAQDPRVQGLSAGSP